MRRQIVLILAMSVILAALGGSGAAESKKYNPVIIPGNFSTTIDNPFFPLIPGTIFTYKGPTEEGEETDVVEVTHSTRVIMGVTCVEVLDSVFLNGCLSEQTLDWYAQDNLGNVWYFGEDTKEFVNGVIVSTAGSWLAGVDGGLPGMVMEADPQVGDTYREEYLKKVAEDMATVLSLNGTAQVPYGSFTDCLVTGNFTRLEKKVVENKWYARGIGMVRSELVQGGLEISELVSIKQP